MLGEVVALTDKQDFHSIAQNQGPQIDAAGRPIADLCGAIAGGAQQDRSRSVRNWALLHPALTQPPNLY